MAEPRVILVTAASGDLAEAAAGALRDAFPDMILHGIDAGDLGPARLVFNTVAPAPRADDPEFPAFLAAEAARVGADMIIPCFEGELRRLASVPAGLPPVIMTRGALIETFLDKYETARWLRAHGLPAPDTWLLTQAPAERLPLLVKPRRGAGSVGIQIVRTPRLLAALAEEHGDSHVAQVHVGRSETEYTCAILRLNGQTRTFTLQRLLQAGRTIRATVACVPVIDDLLTRLAEAAEPAGPLNAQLRLDEDGQPWVFEINPRFSSTVKMRHMLGFRDLAWMIAARGGAPLPAFTPPVGRSIVRLSRELILPDPQCGTGTEGDASP